MFKHIRWPEFATENLAEGLERQYFSGTGVTLARFFLKKGVLVPEHSHPQEQIAYILEGALRFTLEGRQVTVRASEALYIPANVPHSAEALEDTLDLDFFVPARQDWGDKEDHYLRSSRRADES